LVVSRRGGEDRLAAAPVARSVAGVLLGPLKLIFYGHDLDPTAGPRQVLADGAG
jgi:hypothetical protein